MKDLINPSSRYWPSFKLLQKQLDTYQVFKLIYNEDKNTYSMPYLYADYKHELDAVLSADSIIKAIKSYLADNLFSNQEIQLLQTTLIPFIESYGDDAIRQLQSRIELSNKYNHEGDAIELTKTIESLQKIKQLLIKEFKSPITVIEELDNPKVFISYSHDDESHKDWVLQLATRLRSNGVNVILDRWNLKLGTDISSFIEQGLSQSHRVICVCSQQYIEKTSKRKGGAGYEKQIITAELLADQDTNWVIPLIKNNPSQSKVPAFLKGRMFIDFDNPLLNEIKYEELLRDLLDEPILPIPPIGNNPFQNIASFQQNTFIPSNERYHSPSTKGVVIFEFSNNNGHYSIGLGELMFETKWSSGGSISIRLYNDPESIKGIAIAKGISEISQIKDARDYDFSSRSRLVHLDQIALLQNQNGFYAAIRIAGIKSDTTGNGIDELRFQYEIQTNGSPSFSGIDK